MARTLQNNMNFFVVAMDHNFKVPNTLKIHLKEYIKSAYIKSIQSKDSSIKLSTTVAFLVLCKSANNQLYIFLLFWKEGHKSSFFWAENLGLGSTFN